MANTYQRKITKTVVDRLLPGQMVWDTEIKGFGVRCQTEAKAYVLKKNIKGRQRWFTIGKHGEPWTAEKARNEALRLLGLIADKKDPAKERDDLKGQATVEDLCDRYIEDYATHHKRPSSVASDKLNIKNYIKPLLGKELVEDIDIATVDRFKLAVKAGKTKGKSTGPQGGVYVANRCLALLSKMINLAIRWGVRKDATNPVRFVEKYKENKIERYLSEPELLALGEALHNAEEGDDKNEFSIAAIRLLLFTGARRWEILSLEWQHVDLENGVLRLPTSKTGAKVIYLNALAKEVLASLTRVEKNPYVIQGRELGAHLVNIRKPWLRIRDAATIRLWLTVPEIVALDHHLTDAPTTDDIRALADGEGIDLPPGLLDVRLHDLRHSFASVAAVGGHSLPMIGKLLGHSQVATTQRYAHLADDPVRAANDAIGKQLQAAMGPPKANVVKLTSGR